MSCTSIGRSLRPAAFLNVVVTNSNKRLRGSGPEARPPIVLRRAPSGLTLE